MPAIVIVLISLVLTACGPNELESQLVEQKKSFQLRYDNLQTQLDSSERKKNDLDKKISLVSNELKESKQHLEEEKLNNQTLKNSIQLLQMDNKPSDIKPLNSISINTLKKQLQDSQSANDTLKQEISISIKELREKTSQFKNMQAQFTEANTQQQLLEKQIEEYKTNNSELNNQLTGTHLQLEEKDQQLLQQSSQAKSIEIDSTTNIEHLTKQLQESQSNNMTLKESLTQIKDDLTKQSAHLDKTFKKYTELELQLSDTIAQLKQSLEKQRILESKLSESNEKLVQTQQRLTSTQQELTSTQLSLSNAEKEKGML